MKRRTSETLRVQYAEAVPGVCVLYVEVQTIFFQLTGLREDLIQRLNLFGARGFKGSESSVLVGLVFVLNREFLQTGCMCFAP